MEKEFYKMNRKRLADKLESNSIAILFSGIENRKSRDVFFPFFANRNFYYLVGLNEPNAVIVIIKDEKGEFQERLFVEQRDEVKEKWFGKRPNSEMLENELGISIYDYEANFYSWLSAFVSQNGYSIYLDFQYLDNTIEVNLSKVFSEKIRKDFPWLRICNMHEILSLLREIKSDREIEEMEVGIRIAKKAFIKLMEEAKVGMTEYQLKALWDYTVSCDGVRDMAFQPIITSGENNFIIHYSDYSRKIKKGDIILCDAGVNWNGLCCDISRAWPINQWFTTKEEAFYKCMLDCSRELFAFVEPGKQMRDIYVTQRKIMRKYIIEYGLAPDIESANKLIWHGGAHHIGFDNHDDVHISNHENRLIEKNMVFAIDIGIYDLEHNIGFRIEDDCLVTENGSRNLTVDIPRDLEDIRIIMNQRL